MPGTTPLDDATAESVAGAAFDASGDEEHAAVATPTSSASADRASEPSAAELYVCMRRKIARSELAGFRVPALEFATITSVAIPLRRQRRGIARQRSTSQVRGEQLARRVRRHDAIP